MSLSWTSHKVSSVIQFAAGVFAFLVVYFVAASNPQGFLIILERMASACLNVTNSIFLRTMIVVSLELIKIIINRKGYWLVRKIRSFFQLPYLPMMIAFKIPFNLIESYFRTTLWPLLYRKGDWLVRKIDIVYNIPYIN